MEPQTNGMSLPQMLSKLTPTMWVVGILFVVFLWVAGSYNGLVRANESVDAQWAQVETQYQRRLDLIPNLVNSVQGAMKQEKEVFTALAEARTRYAGAGTQADKVAAANQIETSFGRLLAIMENYPQLRSIEAVQSLMAELAGTENRVAVERSRYNEVVRDFNVQVKSFPGGMLARFFGYVPRTMFDAATGAENAPKVEF